MQNLNYIVAGSILVLLGLGLALLPEKNNRKELSAEQLVLELTDETRFASGDLVAGKIISKDPVFLLVDVRTPEAFAAFALPNAINIPLENLLDEESAEILDRDYLDIVFYSDDDLKAEQAWMLKKRSGAKSIHILKGGLNQWIKDFFLAAEPNPTAPREAHEQYQFRQAARTYFLGGSRPIDPSALGDLEPAAPAKREIKVLPKKPAAQQEEEEGC